MGVLGRRASAEDVAAAVAARRASAVDVVAAALGRATACDGWLRAFVGLRKEEAIAEAATVDTQIAAGGAVPRWAGVPIAVKGAAGLYGEAAGLPGEQVQLLRSAGAVPVGVTAVPRGGGPQTWGFTDRGPTRNPWRPELSSGGSSAGSAAAVAAGVVPVATGSDGAGSARIPAAWCGIYGYKPTTGLVASLDSAGLGVPAPLSRDPRDLAAWAEIVIGALPGSGPPPVRACWSADLGYAGAQLDPQVVAPTMPPSGWCPRAGWSGPPAWWSCWIRPRHGPRCATRTPDPKPGPAGRVSPRLLSLLRVLQPTFLHRTSRPHPDQ